MKINAAKIFASLIIVVFLSLQTFATFRLCSYLPQIVPFLSHQTLTQYCSPNLWPFLTYPMYRKARYKGDKIVSYRAYAVFHDSIEVRVLPEDMNMGFWKFRWDFVPAVRKNERSRIENYSSLIRERYERQPISLRLEEHPWILRDDGIEEGSPEVLTEIQLATGDSLR